MVRGPAVRPPPPRRVGGAVVLGRLFLLRRFRDAEGWRDSGRAVGRLPAFSGAFMRMQSMRRHRCKVRELVTLGPRRRM